MREQVKQVLKNAVYRSIGETASAIGAVNGHDRTLRVLMYHKINDLPNNRMSMPVSLFDEQMSQLRELGYRVVDLDAVLAHYGEGAPLPDGAVLITFDDGYRDNLVNAAPILKRHGYSAVQFVPIAYVGRSLPLPHERKLIAHGVRNPTVDWDEMRELETYGVRIESHGISHKPLAELEIDEAAREITISKLKLEELKSLSGTDASRALEAIGAILAEDASEKMATGPSDTGPEPTATVFRMIRSISRPAEGKL